MRRVRAFFWRLGQRLSSWLRRSPWQAVTPSNAHVPTAGRFYVRQLLSGRELPGYRGNDGATALRIFKEYCAFRPGTIECLQIDPDGSVHRRGYRPARKSQ